MLKAQTGTDKALQLTVNVVLRAEDIPRIIKQMVEAGQMTTQDAVEYLSRLVEASNATIVELSTGKAFKKLRI